MKISPPSNCASFLGKDDPDYGSGLAAGSALSLLSSLSASVPFHSSGIAS